MRIRDKQETLLDSDSEGKKQEEKYMRDFGLPECQFVMHFKKHPEIEKTFDEDELIGLYKFAFGQETRPRTDKTIVGASES